MLPDSLPELLQTSVIFSLAMVLVLERLAWFQALTADRKKLVTGVLWVVIAAVLATIQAFVPGTAIETAAGYYVALRPFLLMLLNLLGGTVITMEVGHKVQRYVNAKLDAMPPARPTTPAELLELYKKHDAQA